VLWRELWREDAGLQQGNWLQVRPPESGSSTTLVEGHSLAWRLGHSRGGCRMRWHQPGWVTHAERLATATNTERPEVLLMLMMSSTPAFLQWGRARRNPCFTPSSVADESGGKQKQQRPPREERSCCMASAGSLDMQTLAQPMYHPVLGARNSCHTSAASNNERAHLPHHQVCLLSSSLSPSAAAITTRATRRSSIHRPAQRT
jgi:hypothetical protein